MALTKPIAGPFNALYIGSASATGTPLSLVPLETTGAYVITYDLPKEVWKRCTGKYEVSGFATLTATLSFLSDTVTATKLAMGNLPTTSNEDDVSSGAQLAVLFYDQFNDSSSIFIPCCEAVVKYSINRDKKTQSQVSITLRYEGLDTSHLFYKRGLTALKAIMGSMSPLP